MIIERVFRARRTDGESSKMKRWLPAMRDLVVMVVACSLFATAARAQAVADYCGDVFTNATGPFDYMNADDRTRTQTAGVPIVERIHFTPEIAGFLLPDNDVLNNIDYTLRAVPNHHPALAAIARFDIEKNIPPRQRSAQCWFERAMRFRPEDGTVMQIYGNWLAKKGKSEEALAAYARAKEINPESPEVHYNMGLLYLRLGQYEKALENARVAYAGNYPLPGLRRKLAEKGYPLE